MLGEILGAAYLCAPLLGGAVVHGACMRYGWLAFLVRPIDGGRTLRGRPIFGGSKTWRGPLAVAAGASAVFALQRHLLHEVPALASLELVDYASLPGAWFGALAGAAAEFAELPNSFAKRQLGIPPGGTARGLPGALFFLWDQLDVLVGYWLVAALVVDPTPVRVAASALVVGGIHPLLTVAGYWLGMRPTPR
jgi:hypothetical protein